MRTKIASIVERPLRKPNCASDMILLLSEKGLSCIPTHLAQS